MTEPYTGLSVRGQPEPRSTSRLAIRRICGASSEAEERDSRDPCTTCLLVFFKVVGLYHQSVVCRSTVVTQYVRKKKWCGYRVMSVVKITLIFRETCTVKPWWLDRLKSFVFKVLYFSILVS